MSLSQGDLVIVKNPSSYHTVDSIGSKLVGGIHIVRSVQKSNKVNHTGFIYWFNEGYEDNLIGWFCEQDLELVYSV